MVCRPARMALALCRKPLAISAVLAVLVLGGGAGFHASRPASLNPSYPTGKSAVAPATFVAFSQSSDYQRRLETFSTATGRALGTLRHAPRGMQLESVAMTASGRLWVTTATGPRVRNDTLGGDPAPNSCRSSILEVQPGRDHVLVVSTSPRSQLINDAVPSPSGDRVAYLESGCRTFFADPHLVIRKRHGGGELTIGSDAASCHGMTAPSWSSDGVQLTFSFTPSTETHPWPAGACPRSRPSELVVASTRHSSQMGAVHVLAPPSGCGYVQSAFDAWGIAAVETCGADQVGPAYLVQLTSALTVTSKFALQSGSARTSLSVSPGGDFVLVDEYEARPDLGPGGKPGPWDWLYDFDGVALRLIHVYPDAQYGISSASW